MELDPGRAHAYRKLEDSVGDTPLIEVFDPELPNGNRLLAKLEFLNPSGSHHDRQFGRMLAGDETAGRIAPGRTPLIEVSTGCSGIALAYAARALGYKATVIVPSDTDRARTAAMARLGAAVVRASEPGLAPCVARLRSALAAGKEAGPPDAPHCPNHTRRRESLASGSDIVAEAMRQAEVGGRLPRPTHYLGVCGSGTTLLGALAAARAHSLEVVAWEPLASGVAFDLQSPGVYRSRFGLAPGTLPHRVLGASQPGVGFPHLEEAVRQLRHSIVLVSDRQTDGLVGRHGRVPAIAPAWDAPRYPHLPVGRTSLGNVALARHLARTTEGAVFLVAFHDPATFYDEVYP
jgi:cysteine synthase